MRHDLALLKQLILREVNLRYRGSMLGILWSIMIPLSMLLIYGIVFSQIFKPRIEVSGIANPTVGFALMLFAGLLIHQFFSETMNQAATLFKRHENFVKKVVFPLELLVFTSIGTALFQLLVGISVLTVACMSFGVFHPSTFIALPITFIMLCLMTSGFAFFLASLCVYIRDLQHLIGLGMTVLLFLSPILYSIEQIPERFRFIIQLNPLTYPVQTLRQLLIEGVFPSMASTFSYGLASIFICCCGYLWFYKTKHSFVDIL